MRGREARVRDEVDEVCVMGGKETRGREGEVLRAVRGKEAGKGR